MNTSDAAKGRWEEIFTHYGLPPHSGNKHYRGACPLCGKKGKFRIDDKYGTGGWICVCGNGNGFDLIIEKTGREYLEICKEIDIIIDNNGNTNIAVMMQDDGHLKAIEYFNSLIPLEKSNVEKYLNSRGIYVMPEHSVRYSLGEYSTSVKADLPAMFCVASNHNNKIKYTHSTFLIGSVKPSIEASKQIRTIERYSGSLSVKLFKHRGVLGVAEGVETALSSTQMYSIPTWATLTSSFMKKFIVPDKVSELYIFADNDLNGTGLAAAFHCGRNNIIKANDLKFVHILWPLKDDSDFNDIILDKEPLTMRWTLKK